MNDKPKWSLRPIDETEAHIVCTCGDVSVHMYQTDEGDFHMAKCINGVWMRADNPLWPDLPSAMVEAERICRITPEQQPDTPPPLSGEWQSCEHGIDAENGDWIFLAWLEDGLWQYFCVQVSCGRNDEDGSYSFGLLDLDGDDFMWDTSDYYMRIKR